MLPVSALLRRADTAAVIVSALAAKATSRVGFRRIATDVARPAETVRAGCAGLPSVSRRCGRCSRCGCARSMPIR